MRKLWKGMFMVPHAWEGVYMAYRTGYDATGCMVMPFRGNKSELIENPALWEKVQKAIDYTGIMLKGIGNCIIDDNDNLHPWGMGPSPDPDSKEIREVFEFAGKHDLGGVQTSVWTDNEQLAVDKFAKLCEVTGEYGLDVNFEFVAWGIADNLQKARTIIEKAGNPKNAKITIDLMHCYYSNVTPEEVAACPPGTFGELHLCDVPHVEFPDNHKDLAAEGRSYRLFMGETGIDYTPWLKVIPDDVMCTPEIPNRERQGEWGSMEYAARTLEECKRYYREHGITL